MESDSTHYVRLNIMNVEYTYRTLQAIVRKVEWLEDEKAWDERDLDTAAAEYKRMVAGIPSSAYGFSDLAKVDINDVDWRGLIAEELADRVVNEQLVT